MFDDRNLKLDLFALTLLALVIFLTLALVSYSPSDPPSTVVFPPGDSVHNLCGRSGALVAHTLFQVFGVGAYYLALTVGILDFLLLSRRNVDQPMMRTFGWILSLVGFSTLAAMILPEGSPGPVIGPGGYLGAAGRGLMEMNFASAGSFILIFSVILAGLLLCTDYVLLRFTAQTVGLSSRGLIQVGRTVTQQRVRPRRDDIGAGVAIEEEEVVVNGKRQLQVKIRGKASDEDAASEEDDEAPSPRIKVKTPAPAIELDEMEEETDEVDSDGDQEEDAPPIKEKRGLRKVVDQALRIRKPKEASRTERDEVMEQLEEASQEEATSEYTLPPIDLLLENEEVSFELHEKEVRQKAKVLEKTFANFGFKVKVVEIETGPVIAQYEVELEAGLRLSKITGLADDLAIALRVPSVRIVAPIPGKNTVGIEVPNETRLLVRMREVMEEANGRCKKMKIPLFLGKDVSGKALVSDLASLPHLLIAGRTGTGKSVCLNSIIVSMIMTRRPDEVRMLMIDPKMVELSPYKTLPHLMHPVVTDMKKAEAILAWAVEKMEERYALLARAGVRHLTVYNQLGEEELMNRLQPESEDERKNIPLHLPFIVVVADELADLMMTAGKDVEQHIIRLAQKSRAVGIHLILATQKPTVDVITGLIKSNLPARIAFQVSSRTDSRVVLDEMGADKLLGNGDMLFLQPGTSQLLRGQGTYLSDDEITSVIEFVGTSEPQFVKELVQLKPKDDKDGGEPGKIKNRDELYESAIDVVVREGRGSVSLLQRALGIGYGRAARLIDFMAEDGFVGEYNGSQAREITISIADWEAMSGQSDGIEKEPAAVKAKRTNKIRPEPELEVETAEDDEYEEVPAEDESAWEEEDEAADAFDEESEADEEINEEETDEESDEFEEEEDEEQPQPVKQRRV